MKIVKQSAELIGLLLPVQLTHTALEGGVIDLTDANYSEIDDEVWAMPGSPERLIEYAGRTCYKSEDKITDDSYKAFVEKVCNQLGHESVMEHSAATFQVVCDRGVSHEFVRHRLASYSQESTRYVNYGHSESIAVIQPPGLDTKTIYDAWCHSMEVAEVTYLWMVKNGVAPQIARSVLPTCLKTELVVTANLREWRHIVNLRTSPKAHPQMREVAGMIANALHIVAPVLFPKEMRND